MTNSPPNGAEDFGNPDISSPHLFFKGVSDDLEDGNFRGGLERLKSFSGIFSESYLFNLLYAKALKGLGKDAIAAEYFRKCCAIAPANQVAWNELVLLQTTSPAEVQENVTGMYDPITEELEKLSTALMHFEPAKTTEIHDPTPLADQKQPFSDDTLIPVPTETLAELFREQGAYKKAAKVYSLLIKIKPQNAEHYQNEINALLQGM